MHQLTELSMPYSKKLPDQHPRPMVGLLKASMIAMPTSTHTSTKASTAIMYQLTGGALSN
jgi:hypothetical protein